MEEKEYLKIKGIPTLYELQNSPAFPTKADFLRGAIPVIECIEKIPCNPCEIACPTGAIKIGKPITNLPQINFEKCTGCGICIAACPGLAIYIKDITYTENEARISFPYEYVPLPQKGQYVTLVGREGEKICQGMVINVRNKKENNKTAVIDVSYPRKYFDKVVTMKRL